MFKLKDPDGGHFPTSLELFIFKKFLTDVTHGCLLQNVFQEEPRNRMENNRNKRLLFDALNQCSLLRASAYTWGKEMIRMLYSFQD